MPGGCRSSGPGASPDAGPLHLSDLASAGRRRRADRRARDGGVQGRDRAGGQDGHRHRGAARRGGAAGQQQAPGGDGDVQRVLLPQHHRLDEGSLPHPRERHGPRRRRSIGGRRGRRGGGARRRAPDDRGAARSRRRSRRLDRDGAGLFHRSEQQIFRLRRLREARSPWMDEPAAQRHHHRRCRRRPGRADQARRARGPPGHHRLLHGRQRHPGHRRPSRARRGGDVLRRWH